MSPTCRMLLTRANYPIHRIALRRQLLESTAFLTLLAHWRHLI